MKRKGPASRVLGGSPPWWVGLHSAAGRTSTALFISGGARRKGVRRRGFAADRDTRATTPKPSRFSGLGFAPTETTAGARATDRGIERARAGWF